MKSIIKRTIFAILSLLVLSSAQSQTLSVKDRWNIKLGYSLYKTTNLTSKLFTIRDDDWGMKFKKKSNVRFELNYGVLKWLEVGGYIAFMNYEYVTREMLWNEPMFQSSWPNYPDAIAPTFGVNANIHILPLFVKNQKCKWDFYIPVRYGGCYLFRHGGEYIIIQSALPLWDNKVWDGKDKESGYKWVERNDNKYRHEYGAGLGAAVYIKNIIGFYTEVMGGQFSYWPELVRSLYSIRVGITAKF